MEASIDCVDTFSNTFSSDHFATSATTSPPVQGDRKSPTQVKGQRGSVSSTGQEQQSAQHVPGLNPRSCVTCRKRKVKCDKKQPCSNCVKGSIECIFPKPGRAPRRTKKPQDAELLARLRRLEGVVQKLGKDADGENISPRRKSSQSSSGKADSQSPTQTMLDHGQASPCTTRATYEDMEGHLHTLNTFKLEKEMGQLVVGEGRSRYVSNGFWSGLTEEVRQTVCSRDEMNSLTLASDIDRRDARPSQLLQR